MSTRDAIRTEIFSRKRKKKLVKLFDQEVEVRQPTIGQISRLAKASEDDRFNALVGILIEYCYVPGTEDKVFDQEDEAALLEMPAGDWVTEVSNAIASMTGVQIEEAEKNLEGTA